MTSSSSTRTYSHAAAWMTLGALLTLSAQLVGCQTERETKADSPQTNVAPADKSTAPVAKKPVQDTEESKNAAEEKPELKAEKGTEPKVEVSEAPSVHAADAPEIKRLVIASEVKDREPVEMQEGKVKEPVVAFVELKHPGEVETGVSITFEHESGKKVGFIKLTVPAESPRYRTWGRTRNIQDAGEWKAVVRSEGGDILAEQSFSVAG